MYSNRLFGLFFWFCVIHHVSVSTAVCRDKRWFMFTNKVYGDYALVWVLTSSSVALWLIVRNNFKSKWSKLRLKKKLRLPILAFFFKGSAKILLLWPRIGQIWRNFAKIKEEISKKIIIIKIRPVSKWQTNPETRNKQLKSTNSKIFC